MFTIDEKTHLLKMTRGDTVRFGMSLTVDGETYEPTEGDLIKLGIKELYEDEECLVEKEIPTDTLIVHIEPEDTQDLDFGEYVWDIQITFANGDVYTFIERAKLKLLEDVVR